MRDVGKIAQLARAAVMLCVCLMMIEETPWAIVVVAVVFFVSEAIARCHGGH